MLMRKPNEIAVWASVFGDTDARKKKQYNRPAFADNVPASRSGGECRSGLWTSTQE